jgi:hypothetical protein
MRVGVQQNAVSERHPGTAGVCQPFSRRYATKTASVGDPWTEVHGYHRSPLRGERPRGGAVAGERVT